jgi:RNA polymerase sigma-70 factor (ECF subfamily)
LIEETMSLTTEPKMDEMNSLLLQRCKRNDPEACNALFSMYNRRIFNTAYRILGEEASAEDALQETLLNIYRGLSNFRGESKFSTWISRITVNVCLGMLRRGKNKPTTDLEEDLASEIPAAVTPNTDPLEHTSLEELRSLIDLTFEKMSRKQGVVVRLHDLEGNTIQEISRIIGCPLGTVKSRLFYGRQEFKEIFNSMTANAYATATVQ